MDKAQLSTMRNKKNQVMVAGSSGKYETPWIPAASHTGCLSSRIKAFDHSYLYNTSSWKKTTAASLATSQWSVWVTSLPEQLSPQTPHHLQTPHHPHKLSFVLTCKPHPILLLVPVHNIHPRNLFHEL